MGSSIRLTLPAFCLLTALALAAGRESEPIVAVPPPEPVDPDRVALGERLFHDPRLSRSGSYSCATCHPIDRAGMDGQALSTSSSGTAIRRNTPTIFNAALNASFNWDGVTDSLHTHTSIVVENLMAMTWPELVARLQSDDTYVTAFRNAYGEEPSQTTISDAIVAYERTLITPDAPFDRYLRGDRNAISRDAAEGYRRFKSYGCASCHQGVNVGGNLYQKFGIFEPVPTAQPADDVGRFGVTGIERDRHVFRVPGLRNVAETAPYFHDGRVQVLEEAVAVMGRHQLGRTLTREDVTLIVEFLRTLTGKYRGRPIGSPAGNGR